MLIIIMFLTIWLFDSSSAITFDDYDDVGLLKCNWAAAYMNNEEIVNDPEIQHEIMLLASHWEGRFGRHGIGADLDRGLLLGGGLETYKHGCVADNDTGLLHSCPPGFLDTYVDAMHMSLLAMALNGSPYATQFFTSSMQSYWKGTLESFLIDQLDKKITFYEEINELYPGFSGVFPSIQWTEAIPYPVSNVAYINSVGYMAWPMLAISRILSKTPQTVTLGQRYKNYVDLIASNFLMIFYRGNGELNREMTILDILAQPSPNNYVDNNLTNHAMYPFDDELTLYFAYFLVNWTSHGGEPEKQKIWQTLKDNTKKTSYKIDDQTVAEVERCSYYASRERFKYLYLPYLDVEDLAKLFFIGELVRTHNSAIKRIPGLFTFGWMYVNPADYEEQPIYCGIAEIGEMHCQKSDHVCPSATFPMILNPKMRGVGLAWYVTMLRSPKMQGPFGSSACAKLPSASASLSLKWDSKLPQLLAFDGGLASIVREILNEMGQLDRFYNTVRDNIGIFRNSSNNMIQSHELFMPTATIKEESRRFSACSTQDYNWVKPTMNSTSLAPSKVKCMAMRGVTRKSCFSATP